MGVCCHDHAGSIAIWGSVRNLVLGDTSGRDKTFSLRTDLRYAIFICDEPLLIWARHDETHTVQCSVVDAAWHEKEDGALVPLELTFHTIRLTHPVAAMQVVGRSSTLLLLLLLTDGSIWEYTLVKSEDGWSVSSSTSILPPQTVPVRNIEIEGNTVSFELQVARPACWLLDFPCIPAAADPFPVLVDVASRFYLGENLVHFTTRINFLHWVVGCALEMCDRGRPTSALAFTATIMRYVHTGRLESCPSWSTMCPVTTLSELENSWINRVARFCLCSWPADVRSAQIAESLTVLKVVHLLQIDLWWLAHSASPIRWSKWCLSNDRERLMLTAWDGQPVDTTVIREECEGDGCPRMIAVQLALVDTARPDGDLESLRASLPLHASRTCFDIILRYHGGWSGWLTRLVENVADGVYSPDNALLLADLGREFGLSLRPSPEWLRWLIADSRLVLTWPAGASADIVLLWTAGRSLVLPSPLKRALSIVQKIRSLTSVCPSLLQTPPHIGVRVPTAPLTRVGSMTSDSVFRCVLPFVDIETACWEALVVGFLDLAQVSEDPSISEQGLFKALLLELFQSSLDIPSRLSAARRAAMTRPAGDTLYLTALMSSLEGFFLSMGAPEQGPDRQAFETVLCETDVSVDAFAAFLSAEF